MFLDAKSFDFDFFRFPDLKIEDFNILAHDLSVYLQVFLFYWLPNVHACTFVQIFILTVMIVSELFDYCIIIEKTLFIKMRFTN